jgi:hypothetical protein
MEGKARQGMDARRIPEVCARLLSTRGSHSASMARSCVGPNGARTKRPNRYGDVVLPKLAMRGW